MATATLTETPATTTPQRTFTARITAEHLRAALGDLAAALAPRPPVPILYSVLVTPVGPREVELAAYDYETAVRVRVPADYASGTTVAVPTSHLRQWARAGGKDRRVTFHLAASPRADGTHELAATDQVVSWLLRTLPDPAEYPTLPFVDGDWTLLASLTGRQLAALAYVGMVAAKDETPPVLTAVRLTVSPHGLAAAATDRYRLARHVVSGPSGGDAHEHLLVRASAFGKVATRWAAKPVVTVHLSSAGNQVAFRSGLDEVVLPVMDGEYPPVDRLFPDEENHVRRVVVDRGRLLALIDQVVPSWGGRTPMSLTPVDGRLVVDVDDDELQATAAVDCERPAWDRPGPVIAEGVSWSFNALYLTEGLRFLRDHDHVEFVFTDKTGDKQAQHMPARPVLLRGVTDLGDDDAPASESTPPWTTDESSTYLLMPVRQATRPEVSR